MEKNIWIWNHYATGTFFNKGGRHYWFAKNLIKKGYKPTIFCANTRHGAGETITIHDGNYIRMISGKIPFVFVKTVEYEGNGFQRVNNMARFSWNLYRLAKKYSKKYGRPDVIIASSVHPLTLVAGIKIAKKLGVPCICEIRDLWPESLVAYGLIKQNSLLTKTLYQGEKWIYKKADAIIMTWEGGKNYICNKGWDQVVKLCKVNHISNGVSVECFDSNNEENMVKDYDLDNNEQKNVVYAGSIREVNNLNILLDAAKIITEKGYTHIKLLIYGDGNEKEKLEKRCKDENIKNVSFKGLIKKKFVPSVLKKANVNVLHNSSTSLDKYGQSQNKLFEYLAAGKCIVQTYSPGYSIIEKYNCGICLQIQNAENISRAIIEGCINVKQSKIMGANARQASYEFDFEKLTGKLIDVINSV